MGGEKWRPGGESLEALRGLRNVLSSDEEESRRAALGCRGTYGEIPLGGGDPPRQLSGEGNLRYGLGYDEGE